MAEAVYIFSFLTSVTCTILLVKAYWGTQRKLLLWCSIAFAFLALNNGILVIDMVVFPDLDLSGPFWRNFSAAIAGSVLLTGLIWELT